MNPQFKNASIAFAFMIFLSIAVYKLYATYQRKDVTRHGICFNYTLGGGKLVNVDSLPHTITKVWKKYRKVNGKLINPEKILWTITLNPNDTAWIKNVANSGSGYYISSVADPEKKYFVVPYDEM